MDGGQKPRGTTSGTPGPFLTSGRYSASTVRSSKNHPTIFAQGGASFARLSQRHHCLLMRLAADVHRIHLEHRRWGLIPSWARSASVGGSLINAPAETAAGLPGFRTALTVGGA